MDIEGLLRSNYGTLGAKECANQLGIPTGVLSQFISGKKTPGLSTCQKIIDLWGKSEPVNALSEAEPSIDGSKVCLCLPWYKETYGYTALCLMAMVKQKPEMRIEMRADDSMITRSRNHLAKRFLDSGCEWSIWFDDDMVFPCGEKASGFYMTITNMRNVATKFLSMNTIDRLTSHGKSIVGGCYWDRRGGGKLIAGGGMPILRAIPNDSIHPVDFIGTGCLAIHRQVFLDVAAKYPETYSKDSIGNECGFFTNIQTPERMLGEDESFAKRATNAGHPSYLDLGLICGHIGQNIQALPEKGSQI